MLLAAKLRFVFASRARCWPLAYPWQLPLAEHMQYFMSERARRHAELRQFLGHACAAMATVLSLHKRVLYTS
jgi:hypothetical protein